MRIKLRDLKRLIREATEESLGESPYSRGGAGGNRHGDSWDEPSGSQSYEDRMREDREERERAERSGGYKSPSMDDVNPYTEAVNEAFRAGYRRGLRAARSRR